MGGSLGSTAGDEDETGGTADCLARTWCRETAISFELDLKVTAISAPMRADLVYI